MTDGSVCVKTGFIREKIGPHCHTFLRWLDSVVSGCFRTPVVDPNLIQVSGHIKIINAEVSLKMAGRVNSRPVEEGLLVQKDDLDDTELKSELALRQAELRGGWLRVVFKKMA